MSDHLLRTFISVTVPKEILSLQEMLKTTIVFKEKTIFEGVIFRFQRYFEDSAIGGLDAGHWIIQSGLKHCPAGYKVEFTPK